MAVQIRLGGFMLQIQTKNTPCTVIRDMDAMVELKIEGDSIRIARLCRGKNGNLYTNSPGVIPRELAGKVAEMLLTSQLARIPRVSVDEFSVPSYTPDMT